MALVLLVASGLPLYAFDLPNLTPTAIIQKTYGVDTVLQPFLVVECGEPKRCGKDNARAGHTEFQVGSILVRRPAAASVRRPAISLEYCNPYEAWDAFGRISGGQVGTPVFELTKSLFIKTLGDFLGTDLAILQKASFHHATMKFVDGRSNQGHPPESAFADQALRFCRAAFPKHIISSVVIRTITARIEAELTNVEATDDTQQFLRSLGFKLEFSSAGRLKITSERFYVIGYSVVSLTR